VLSNTASEIAGNPFKPDQQMFHGFDVSGTCINRPCILPGTVFEMHAHEEGLDRIAGYCGLRLTEQRIAAERRSKKTTSSGEPNLEEMTSSQSARNPPLREGLASRDKHPEIMNLLQTIAINPTLPFRQ